MKRWRGRILVIIVLVAVAAFLAWAFRPHPLPVELATVTRGPMDVTIEDDGQTRVRERYTIAAPLTGRLRRIEWDAGDAVTANESVLAVIEPEAAAMLNERSAAEAEARVEAAAATLQQVESNQQRAVASLELAKSDYVRLQELSVSRAAAWREVNDARILTEVRQRELEAAQHATAASRFELEQAKAALVYTRPGDAQSSPPPLFEIRSPVTGRVLRIIQKSAAPTTPGMALLEIGDPRDLEVQVDVLSSDAVRIVPGADAWLDNWGGDQSLRARVRVVEPFAFTKVSALGVEEQRVYVIADIVDPPERWSTLGDGYRVDARFVIWHADDALKVPTSALFRTDGKWTVFVEHDGQAELRTVDIGRQTATDAQVLDGLREGDRVVAYPSDQVTAGRTVVGQ